jgi:hypothetical protein
MVSALLTGVGSGVGSGVVGLGVGSGVGSGVVGLGVGDCDRNESQIWQIQVKPRITSHVSSAGAELCEKDSHIYSLAWAQLLGQVWATVGKFKSSHVSPTMSIVLEQRRVRARGVGGVVRI